MRHLALPLLVLSALPAAAAPQTSRVELAQEVVSVPFDHTNRHVAVEVEINGKGPFAFQVDTYASIDACIDDDLARELGLPVTGTTLNSDGTNTQMRDLVTIDELRLGGATFRNMRTLVDN